MKTAPRQTQNKNVHDENIALPFGFVSGLALLAFGALCLLMIVAPSYLSGLPAAAVDLQAGDAYVPPMTLLSLTAIVCLLLGIGGVPLSRSALGLGVAAFFVWCALSVFNSVYRHDSLLEIARLSGCLAWFFIARTLLCCEDERHRKARHVVLLACLVAGISFVGASALFRFVQTRDPRQFGTFFNPNLLANYCAMSLPLALSLLLLARRNKNLGGVVFSIAALMLIGGGLVVTSSKGGFLSALCALFIFAVAALRARGKTIFAALRGHRKIALAATLFVLVFGGTLFTKTILPRLQAASGGEDNSTMFRVYTWQGTLDMAEERPLFGWGAGAFQSAYPQFAVTGFTRTAHQVWLQLAAESGFPAALLLLGVCALGARCAWRSLTGREWPLAAGGLATLTAFVVHGLTDAGWSLISIALLLMVTLALLDSLKENRSILREEARPSFNYAWLVSALIFGVCAAGYGRVVQGEDAALEAREMLAKGMPQSALQKAREATETNPLSARLWRNRARIEMALRQDAEPSLRTALRLQPTRAAHYVLLAETIAPKDARQAFFIFKDAINVDPNDTGTRISRANFLMSSNIPYASQIAWRDYEYVAMLYDAPYGKYPAIAEMVNLDFVRAFLKLGERALSQKNKSEGQRLVNKGNEIIARWNANAERNRRIAEDSQTLENFEREAGEVEELAAQLNNLASRLKEKK